MPYFTDSFWSPDFKIAIDTLFEGLFKNCEQNELYITLFANQMEMEVLTAKRQIANSNESLKKIKMNDRDMVSTSIYQSLIALNNDALTQGTRSLEIAQLIETSVLEPFTKWCKEHKQRLEYSDRILRDNIVNFHKFKNNLINKLEQTYMSKCRVLQDFKVEVSPRTLQDMDVFIKNWKHWDSFLKEEREYANFTKLCNGKIDVDVKTMKMILRSLLLELEKHTYKIPVFGYNITNTNTGHEIVEWLLKIMSLNSRNRHEAEIIGQELVNLNFLKTCSNNLSLKKSQFIDSKEHYYQWKVQAFDFIDVDSETLCDKVTELNVPNLDKFFTISNSHDQGKYRERKQSLASLHKDKPLPNISKQEVEKNVQNLTPANNQEFDLDNDDYDENLVTEKEKDDVEKKIVEAKKDEEKVEESSTKDTKDSSEIKIDLGIDDSLTQIDLDEDQEDLQPPPQRPSRPLTDLEIKYDKLIQEVKFANWKYFESVTKAEKLRCSLEELILDHLVFMEKCERDRMYAIKKATEDAVKCYESNGQLMTLPLTEFHFDPENDLKNFVLKYRVGVYQPFPIIYKNYFGGGDEMMERQIFGIDLSVRCRLDHSKVPKLITKFLRHFDNQVYPELENDDVRCLVWTKSVKLNESHKLRFQLNNSFTLSSFKLDGLEPSVIASVLKIYLLELPIPLIPQELNDVLKKIYHITDNNDDQDSATKDNEKFIAIASVFARIPKLHLATLDAISTHFVRLLSIIGKTSVDNENLPVKFIELISQEFANCVIRLTTFNDNVLGYKIFKDLLTNKKQIFNLLKQNIKQLNELNN